jgi:hypothetical protein
MGFFGVVGRIIAGKPAFTPGTNAKASPESPHATQSPSPLSSFAASTARKEIPELHLGRVENLMQGGRYELYVDVVNSSREPVFLDNVALLGTNKELDSQLKPGEARQHLLYRGQPFTNPLHGAAQLRYRKQADGDYFMTSFEIRSRRESDGYFKVSEFRQLGPVKDI